MLLDSLPLFDTILALIGLITCVCFAIRGAELGEAWVTAKVRGYRDRRRQRRRQDDWPHWKKLEQKWPDNN